MKKFNKDDIVAKLYKGKKFRATTWKKTSFIHVVGGQIVDNDSQPFNLSGAKDDTWVAFKKKKKSANTNQSASNAEEIAELKKMIMTLTKDKTQAPTKTVAVPKADNTPTDKHKSQNKNKVTNMGATSLQEILECTYGATSPKDIHAQFKERLEDAKSTRDIEKAVCEYIPFCWAGGRTPSTTTSYYSHMRNVIKKAKINDNYRDTALALFLPTQRLYETVQGKVVENKKEEIRNKNTFNKEAIEEKIAFIRSTIEEDIYPDKAKRTDINRERAYWAYVYLTMVTGRRQSEILKTLIITPDAKRVWEYCGIIKDREDGKCIKAYSLDDDFEFLNNLTAFIQEHLETDKYTLREINAKFNSVFNNALKRITGMSYTASDWRDIYAEMMFIQEAKDDASHIDKRDFKGEVLGHEYNSNLSATEHYDGWEAE